jgi:carbonic anhydrase
MKNNAVSLVADVRRIRNHPLIPKSIPVYGYIYDVRTGKLDEVPEAMAMGKGM